MERMEVHYRMHVGDLAYAKQTFPWLLRWWWQGGMFSIPLLCMIPATLLLIFAKEYALAAVAWVLLLALIFWLLRKMHVNERQQQANVEKAGEIRLSIQPDAMESHNEHSWSRRAWTCIASAKLVERHVVLQIKPMLFHVIPQEAFAAPQDAARFVELTERFRHEEKTRVPISLPPLPESFHQQRESHLASITFEGTHDELQKFFSSCHQTQNQEPQEQKKIGRFGTIFLLLILAAGASQLERNALVQLLGIAALFFSLFLGYRAMKYLGNQIIRAQVRSIPLGLETVWVTPQGVLVDGFYGQAWQSWMIIDRVSDHDSHIVFWQGQIAVNLIPKRAFSSNATAFNFQQVAEEARQKYRATHDDDKLTNQPSTLETGNPYQPPQSL